MRLFNRAGRLLIAAGGATVLWCAFVAFAALVAPPRPAAAAFDAGTTPLKGSVSGVLIRQPLHGGGPAETDWSVTIRGSGQVTHMGRVQALITNDDVTLLDPGHLGPTGAPSFGQFTAPNGDRIFGVYHWTAGPALMPGVLSFSGTFEVTGGDGRFKDATGGGTFVGRGNVITNAVEVTFDGAVSPPHGRR